MKLINYIKNFFSNFLGLENLKNQNEKNSLDFKELEERITNIEIKLIEMSRAVSMLALAHAGLIREMGHIADSIDKKKKAQQARKTEDDFTN